MPWEFKYLGLYVHQTDTAIEIDQRDYVEGNEEIPIINERQAEMDAAVTADEKSKMRSLSGKMLWVTNQTRPDMAYETCMMCNLGKSPTVLCCSK